MSESSLARDDACARCRVTRQATYCPRYYEISTRLQHPKYFLTPHKFPFFLHRQHHQHHDESANDPRQWHPARGRLSFPLFSAPAASNSQRAPTVECSIWFRHDAEYVPAIPGQSCAVSAKSLAQLGFYDEYAYAAADYAVRACVSPGARQCEFF